jgi:hypothetical protein
MRVWPLLTIPVYAGALMLMHISRATQTSIALYWNDGNISSAIISNQKERAGAIYGHVARSDSKRWLLIQELQFAGVSIDRKCADGPTGFAGEIRHLVHRKQIASLRINSEEGRIHNSGGGTDLLQLT